MGQGECADGKRGHQQADHRPAEVVRALCDWHGEDYTIEESVERAHRPGETFAKLEREHCEFQAQLARRRPDDDTENVPQAACDTAAGIV